MKKVKSDQFCIVCNVEQGKLRRSYKDLLSDKVYKLYFCSNCGFEWWEPRELLPEIYENEEMPGYEWLHGEKNGVILHNHEAFFRLFPSEKGRLLDIGCSTGNFLIHGLNVGFDGYGIDIDSKAVKVANERGLKNVYSMSLDKFTEFAQEKELKFEVITFFDVLEHQDDPGKFLDGVTGLLSENGFIAGSMPNQQRGMRGLLAKYLADHPPHHYFHWSEENLKKFLIKKKYVKIYVEVLPTGIEELKGFFETHVFGRAVRFLRKNVISSVGRGGDASYGYKHIVGSESRWVKRMVLKVSLTLKDFFFCAIALFARFFFVKKNKGTTIYFHAKVKDKNAA